MICFYMFLPAFLMHVNGTPGTVVNMSSYFLATNRAIHRLPPVFPIIVLSSATMVLTKTPFADYQSWFSANSEGYYSQDNEYDYQDYR